MCLSVDGTWEFIVAECDRDAVAAAVFLSEHAAVFAASEWMYAIGIYIVTASAIVWITAASNWVYRLLDVRGFARSVVTDRIWLVFVRCAASVWGPPLWRQFLHVRLSHLRLCVGPPLLLRRMLRVRPVKTYTQGITPRSIAPQSTIRMRLGML